MHGTGRDATDGDGSKLLHSVQRTRHGFVLDRCNGAEWHELIVRAGDVNILQLFGIEPVHPFDLRDYLVTQAVHVEPIHKITADAGRKIRPDLLHIEPHGRNLVMIENDLRLWLIDLGVDVAKLEHVCLHRFEEDSPGQLENAFLAGSGSDYETDRKIITARERFGHDREHLDSRNGPKFLLDNRQVRFGWRLARAPRF